MELKPRLRKILRSVPKGTIVADIGTDHAFLPIALIREGIAKKVIACDIKEGPLSVAKENICRYNAPNIELRLCDGLSGLAPNEAQAITIAGMGGDVIKRILANAEWIKNEETLLILQPMSSPEALREYLYQEGFGIIKEEAVEDSGRVYSVISAVFRAEPQDPSLAQLFIGELDKDTSAAAERYIRWQQQRLSECAQSLQAVARKRDEYHFYKAAAEQLYALLSKRENK